MHVFSNLAISLDGKIATATREHFPLGTAEDLREMVRLRKKCDAILVGASTLRAYRRYSGFEKNKNTRKLPWNIILSNRLEGVSPRWPFFSQPGGRRILFVSPKTPAKTLAQFEKSCTLRFIDEKSGTPIAQQVIHQLDDLGIKKLLVEGGGKIMWDFAKDNLIHSYHVTLTPRIVGGTEAPTLVDGEGLARKHVLNLKLKSCRRVGDELYLIYERRARRGP